MTLTEPQLRQLDDPTLSRDEAARLRCRAAAELERRGQYETARDALGELWRGVGQRPALEGLSELTAAEALLRAGALSGWFGSARQIEGAQEAAKDLISESITRFQALGDRIRVADGQSELGLCYKRAGAYDEARVVYNEALRELLYGDDKDSHATRSFQPFNITDICKGEACPHPPHEIGRAGTSLAPTILETVATLILRLAIVESTAAHYNEALRILTDSAQLFDESGDDALKGKFHNEVACILMFLTRAEHRQDYADRAIIEYTAASHYFEQAGHTSYRARAENNLGLLLYFIGRYQDAHGHLDRARLLFIGERDVGSVAQVDETRARVLLAQGQARKAERVIREAARALEKGGEQALLAEALTTQGRVLARLGDFAESLHALRRAAELAELAGALEDAGLALLTLVEEHAERLAEFELLDSYRRADELLKGTQDAETVARLRACASRVVSARLASLGPRRLNERTDFWANFNLAERVRAYEARYIRRALIEAGGSVTLASRLLGYPHHATLQSMLEGRGRHTDLVHLRIPPERRRRAVSRVRAPRAAGHCLTPTQSRQPSVLYVEDTKLVAIAVKETLELDGYRVEVCEDGTSGLDRLASGAHYDLLIFDQELPGASGVELVQYARGLPQFRRVPIILVSASDYAAEAVGAGVDVFLKKPDEIWKLSETVARLLGEKTGQG